MTSKLKEGVMQGVFTLCACVSILAVALICIFLFANGVPTLFKIGPLKFLLGTTWKPGNDIFGILPMILGSIYVTAGAILVGVPIGLLTAIYMSKFASPRINKVMLPAVQLLAGIPSVVFNSILRRLTGNSVRIASSSTFLYSPPAGPTSLYFVTTRVAFTSTGEPSLPMAASFNTRGTEAPSASFTTTGGVTASRQETTKGTSPFTATH